MTTTILPKHFRDDLRFTCEDCWKVCRASQEHVDACRADNGHGPDVSDADIVGGFVRCLECAAMGFYGGEKVERCWMHDNNGCPNEALPYADACADCLEVPGTIIFGDVPTPPAQEAPPTHA